MPLTLMPRSSLPQSRPRPTHQAPQRFPLRAPSWSLIALVALTLLWLGCQKSPEGDPAELATKPEPTTQQPVHPETPRLVLLVVVDQMRGDYLDRFAPLFEHGFARLRQDGQVFTDAHQDHATTTTAPGHATIATGTYPSSHGVVGNNWFDRESGREVYAVEDDENGRSPLRMLRPTLGDQLKRHWPRAKVFSVGGKDRSTVLTAGREADGAYWYDPRTGRFTSSKFYPALPAWLEAFNDEGWPMHLFGTPWKPLVTLAELQRFGITALDRDRFGGGFPYTFGGPALSPGSSFYAALNGSPWMDSYVAALAQLLIEAEGLGDDDVPDFLVVNFSAPDAVGHSFGPDSPELVDTLIRLDRTLGDLLDAIDRRLGLDQVLVALSSDHGVGQVPEVASERGLDGSRLGTEAALCFQQLGVRLAQRFGLEGTAWMPGLLVFDRTVLAEHSVDFNEIRQATAAGLRTCPRVEKVISPEALEASSSDPLLTLFQHSYLAVRSPDLLLHLSAGTLATSTTASHGTAHRYDTWVPMIFQVPGFPAQRIESSVSVTDIAATVAAVLGLPGEEYDGLNRLPELEGGPARWDETNREVSEQ